MGLLIAKILDCVVSDGFGDAVPLFIDQNCLLDKIEPTAICQTQFHFFCVFGAKLGFSDDRTCCRCPEVDFQISDHGLKRVRLIQVSPDNQSALKFADRK